MSLNILEALLAGIAVLLLGVILVLLHFARRMLAEARGLRDQASEARTLANLKTRLLDVTPTLTAALDGMHRYLAVNQAFEKVAGLDRARLIGKRASSLPDAAGPFGVQLETYATQCAASDQVISEVIKVTGADGQVIDFLLVVQPTYGDTAATRGTLVALVDVTARLSAEREAREIKDTVEDLLEALPMAFFRVREEPGGHRWFPFIVGHTERFMRLPASEISRISSGGNLASILEGYWPAARRAMDESSASGAPIQVDLEAHRPHDDGWIRIGTAAPRRNADKSIEWNGYLVDVTQEHRDAQALTRAKAAAEANTQAKSRFLAAMSHEIRTPLATALGALELLKDTSMDTYQCQQVELADNASRLLIEILGDILDFSRLEEGPVPMENIPCALREILDQVLHIFASRARDKGLTLDLRVAPEVAAEHLSDPVRVKQIVLNLVGNAIKFTAKGGVSVTIDVVQDQNPVDALMQTVVFSVSDSGIGISPEAQSRLFRPFSQADASTARQYGGSGLGLAICQRLIHLMHGQIEVESAENRGSCFKVRLPMRVRQALHADAALHGKRVHIAVDRNADEAALQDYARTAGMLPTPIDENIDLHIADQSHWPLAGPRRSADTGILFVPPSADPQSASSAALILAGGPIRWSEFRRVCLSALQTEHPVTESSPIVRENSPRGDTARILVVEDHQPYQIVIRNMLEKLGVQVDVVADGLQALGRLEQTPYSLMLTDCHMPEMDGFELTRRVRAHRDAHIRALPIVALSADVSAEHRERIRSAGLNDFLIKPVNLSTLRTCIEKWTDTPASTLAFPERNSLPITDRSRS
ncbi:ATP-binding protein [Achromobacter seleniivolatilans]|uniref:histidine kinase n=1 Tax=Achromobacter seleniivolatilans TaxID=3047478 RepID=A0ABY9M1D7_9BURK|nr:ATP-binding protein [Achromobacter sp. R39]WMD20806.1 ATP-binding protein [Achromobacter sp. R39]